MTIAAGVLHSEGVLLCSDTRMEGGATKFQAPKLGMFNCHAGKFAFAFAGNASFALSAIQKCSVAVQDRSATEALAGLEAAHEREYRRSVYEHPDYRTNPYSLSYQLIFVFWSEEAHKASLFVSNDHIIHACYGSEFIGLGFELANALTRPFWSDPLSEHDALILAAYTLSQVKTNVPGCEGESVYVSIRHDGTVAPIVSVALTQVEEVAGIFDKAAHELLFAMGEEDGDSQLDERIATFVKLTKDLSIGWRNIRKTSQAALQYRRLTTTGPSPEPPLPESP